MLSEVRRAKGLPTVAEERALAEEARRREAEEQALCARNGCCVGLFS